MIFILSLKPQYRFEGAVVHLLRHGCLHCFVSAKTRSCWAGGGGIKGYYAGQCLNDTLGLGLQGLTVFQAWRRCDPASGTAT